MAKYEMAPTVAAGLLRMARDRAEVTQAELAERAGVSQQAVSAYETGRKEPTLPTLMRLLEAAGFEMRIRLEHIEGHDETVEAFLDSLPPAKRGELEAERSQRAAKARLRRVRGR